MSRLVAGSYCYPGTDFARWRRTIDRGETLATARDIDRLTTVPAALIGVFGVGLAIPLIAWLSLRGEGGAMFGHGYALDNYRALWAPLYARVLSRSLLIAGATGTLTVLLAYPVAGFLAFHAGARRTVLLTLVTLPFWTSYLLRVFAWKAILGYRGVINSVLVSLHVVAAPLHGLLYRPPAVLITLSHAYAAFAVLPIYVALRAIDPRLIEAGRDLGAAPAQLFARIVLPLSMPGVIAAFVTVFIPAFGDYTAPALVGGLSSTMIGSLIEAQFDSVADWPFGATLAMLVVLVIGLVVLAPALLAGWLVRRSVSTGRA